MIFHQHLNQVQQSSRRKMIDCNINYSHISAEQIFKTVVEFRAKNFFRIFPMILNEFIECSINNNGITVYYYEQIDISFLTVYSDEDRTSIDSTVLGISSMME